VDEARLEPSVPARLLADLQPSAATLWDTAGQERFRTLTSSFYRGAHGILLVYDVTRPETFDALEQWLGEVDHFCAGGGKSVAKLLVGNKADKDDLRAVSFADGEAWARSQGMLFMETSAKTKEGISQAFEEVLEKILETPALLAGTAPARPAGAAAGSTAAGSGAPDVDLDSSASPGGGGCCG